MINTATKTIIKLPTISLETLSVTASSIRASYMYEMQSTMTSLKSSSLFTAVSSNGEHHAKYSTMAKDCSMNMMTWPQGKSAQ